MDDVEEAFSNEDDYGDFENDSLENDYLKIENFENVNSELNSGENNLDHYQPEKAEEDENDEQDGPLSEFRDMSNFLYENEDPPLEETLFDLPLYKQRYHAVSREINKANAKRVLDMGCSEGYFLPVIKSMCPRIQEISGVDIDLPLLERMTNRLKPLSIEYVLKREYPLTMRLMHGSITEPAHSFIGVDFVSCIEVIQHLTPEDLGQVPEAVFGVLRPKTVAITTPNSEYNVFFKDFTGMRHWDHKFEWTRKEFKDWCNNIVKLYPYKVTFSGIGERPEDNVDIGCCSQMALFKRQPQHPWLRVLYEPEKRTEYEVVHEFVYPYDIRTRRDKLLNEISYLINHFYSNEGEENDETFTREIELTELLGYAGIKRYEPDCWELVDILRNSTNSEYNLSEDSQRLIVHFQQSDFLKDWQDEGEEEDGNELFSGIGDKLGNDEDDDALLYEDEQGDWDI